jgi:hypothetical protein
MWFWGWGGPWWQSNAQHHVLWLRTWVSNNNSSGGNNGKHDSTTSNNDSTSNHNSAQEERTRWEITDANATRTKTDEQEAAAQERMNNKEHNNQQPQQDHPHQEEQEHPQQQEERPENDDAVRQHLIGANSWLARSELSLQGPSLYHHEFPKDCLLTMSFELDVTKS